ncbi:MAG: PAS domain S-box protein [Halorientalis sp.]
MGRSVLQSLGGREGSDGVVVAILVGLALAVMGIAIASAMVIQNQAAEAVIELATTIAATLVGLGIGMFGGYYYERTTGTRAQTHEQLEATNRALRELRAILTDHDGDFETKLQRLLVVGCEQFELDIGALSRIDGDRYEVIGAVDDSGTITSGDVYDTDETLCARTVQGEPTDVVAIQDLDTDEYDTQLADGTEPVRAYIGTPVVVDGETYGTVAFASRTPRAEAFTERDRRFLTLLAQWLGSELERRRREIDLRQNRELLAQSQRLANVGAWELDLETDELLLTDEVYRLLDLPTDASVDLDRAIEFYHPEDQPTIRAAVEQAIDEGEPYDHELRLQTATGAERWVHAIGEPIEIGGQIRKIRGSMQDITECKQTVDSLREQEHRLERHREYVDDVLDAIDDVFFVIDDAGVLGQWNDSLTEVTGYADDEIESMHAVEFFPEYESERVEAAMDRLRRGQDVRMEADYQAKDGTTVPYEFVSTSLSHPDGERVITGIGRDISDRKQRQEQLERYETIVQAVGDPVYALDADGAFLFVNDAIEALAGYDPDDLVGEHVSTVMTDADLATARDHIRTMLSRGERPYVTFEMAVRTADGGSIPTENHMALLPTDDGQFRGTAGVVREITERKAREQALERQRYLLERTQELAAVGGWEIDLRSDSLRWTDEVCRIHELPLDYEPTLEAGMDFYHPDDRPAIENALDRCTSEGDPYDLELRKFTSTGDLRWVRTIGRPWYDDDGDVIGARGAIQDITEHKAREREFELAETLFENTQDVLFVVDVGDDGETFTMERINPAHEAHTGLSNDEIRGQEMREIFGDSEGSAVVEQYRRCVSRREPIQYEVELSVPESGTYWETRLAPVVIDDQVDLLVGATRNITERKTREEELERHRSLLERTQELAGVGGWELDLRTDPPYDVIMTDELYRIHDVPTDEGWNLEKGIEFYHPDDRARVRGAVERAIEGGESFDLEAQIVTAEGTIRWVRTTGEPVTDDGEIVKISGALQDITERKDSEERLQRQQHLLEQTQQLAHVGGWELDLRGGPPYEGMMTDELYRIHDVPTGDLFDSEEGIEFYHPEDQPRIRDAVERAIDHGESYDLEAQLRTAAGDDRWVRTTGEPVTEDGEIVKLRGSVQDITERKHYELALRSLHDATRDLLHTDSEDDICDVVIDIVTEIIDVPGVGLYLLDTETSEFVPTACTSGFVDLCSGTPALPVGDERSPAWSAFVSGETVTLDASTPLPWLSDANATDNPVESGLCVPIGDHGVLVAVSPADEIDTRTRQLVETLVATTEAAFDRLESEASVRERDQQLQAQNRRLKRQIRITDILRTVDQSLIDATSREEIQRAVCERLVESDLIKFAWIGERDPAVETVQPQTWAGEGHSYLDSVSLDGSGEPAWTTAETESPTVVTSVLERLQSDPWRKVALEHEFQSVISVPLTYDEYTYGVLTAYAVEPNAFGDLERDVFVELGETIGNAITGMQTRQALYSDSVTELKLRFTGEELLLSKLATEADCRVEFDGLSTDGGSETRLFFSVTGAQADVIEGILEQFVSVTDYRTITTTEDGGHFEVTLSDGLITSTLVPHSVSLRSMVAEAGTLEMVVDVPRETDIREFIELLEERYQTAELIARRDIERSIGTKADLVESLLDSMSERQREALTTAYYSGFFEWPRETTGQEVATMLDVSQPTINRHLRLAQRSLLDQLFDTEHTTPTVTP